MLRQESRAECHGGELPPAITWLEVAGGGLAGQAVQDPAAAATAVAADAPGDFNCVFPHPEATVDATKSSKTLACKYAWVQRGGYFSGVTGIGHTSVSRCGA